MSEILESVETAEGVEIISGEDLLAKEMPLKRRLRTGCLSHGAMAMRRCAGSLLRHGEILQKMKFCT
jgi:hypothetical protein